MSRNQRDRDRLLSDRGLFIFTNVDSIKPGFALTLALSPREREQESGSLLPQGEGLGMRANPR
jgi:hypothetical protein